MRLLLVEDNRSYGEHLVQQLERAFPASETWWVLTESEFIDSTPRIRAEPPDLVIMDMLVRWDSLRTMKTAPSDLNSYRGGLRCILELLRYDETRNLPIILHTVLDRAVVEDEMSNLPANVVYAQKHSDNSALLAIASSMLAIHGDAARVLPRVFLVHGHNVAVRESTARFLERLAVEVIILDERAATGRTIVEQLEAHSNVAFAVVLMTADDIGRGKDQRKPKPRARQNVIFELGYFVARLGRSRVCCLYEDGVEIPTDYLAVIYIELDRGGSWKTRLAKEMRAAGIFIDASALL